MSTRKPKRASEARTAETSQHPAEIQRRPSHHKHKMAAQPPPLDLAAIVKIAVTEALRAQAMAQTQPIAAAATASPPPQSKWIVTGREIPEGFAANFLSHHGVRC